MPPPLLADGGPAFPVPMIYDGQSVSLVTEHGMSLRQYFAAAAMTGLLANTTFNHFAAKGGKLVGGIEAEDVAEVAYRMADALIAAGATDEGR